MYKVGIIGDRDSIQGFAAVGLDTIVVDYDYAACRAAFGRRSGMLISAGSGNIP